jgi:hypothetical protein
MIPLKKITDWLLEEYKLSYGSFRNYFLVGFVCLCISFLFIIFFLDYDFGMLKKLLISKSGCCRTNLRKEIM